MTRRRQSGFGLLELLAVLALGALLGGGVLAILEQDWERARLRDAARRHAELTTATGRYLEARRDALAGELPLDTATALTLAQLQAAGYLAASFAPQNSYRHSACVLLVRSGAGASSQVAALVSASGGDALTQADLAEMAASAGPGAGYLEAALPLTARGAFGAWRIDNATLQRFTGGPCPGGALAPGRLASMLRQPLAGSGAAPDYLARVGSAADAPWNVMETPLALGSGATATVGAACGADPAIAVDANRELLSCAGNGAWKRQGTGGTWKETRASYSALPTGDTPGDVRMAKDSGRAFVARSGDKWQGLAVDQNGQLEVPAAVRAKSLATTGHLDAGSATAAGTLRGGRDVLTSGNVSGNNVEVWSWSVAHANWVNGGGDAWAGMPCNLANQKVAPDGKRSTLYPIGSMKRDKDGITMSCQAPHNQYRYLNGGMTP